MHDSEQGCKASMPNHDSLNHLGGRVLESLKINSVAYCASSKVDLELVVAVHAECGGAKYYGSHRAEWTSGSRISYLIFRLGYLTNESREASPRRRRRPSRSQKQYLASTSWYLVEAVQE